MRLIDADELIDNCKKYLNSLNSSWYGKECTRIYWLIGILSNAHTIEPQRKKGKWIDGYKRQTCSVCKQSGYRSWNFCPNCGSYNGGADEV